MADQVMLDVSEDKKVSVVGELPLSDEEREVLALYDQLEKLKLEARYYEALKEFPIDDSGINVTDEAVRAAKVQLLEAKSLYNLRNNIIESVLTANPILQAVHAGEKANLVERDLLPLIKTRDELSIQLTDATSKTLVARAKLIGTQQESVIVGRQNAELASKMMKLAEKANTRNKEDVEDPAIRARLEELEQEAKINRQKWRLMKGMASAIVAGSGVDWARDQALRELVLDNDDEDDR